ncbi:MAG: tRNA pseudouridine(55) synthase TruB [Eubacterium sp.]|nr:tRNA pseudouridine(55) synthase TruB [Eubacterium sp.]
MYNGIVNIYKEQGFTSHDVVAKLRGIYGQKKIGHTGTLDPMAEGVLIVCLGQATKLSDLILTKDKQYIAKMKLGVVTDTDDTSGNIKASKEDAAKELFEDVSSIEERLKMTFGEFVGPSMQIPPMYSAIKVNGKKLYEYARAGIEIEREPRPIEIYEIQLQDIFPETQEVSFSVRCSKGTYIRSLIRDIGEKLEVGATMSGLLRDDVNGIKATDGYKISDLQSLKDMGRLEETVQPMDKLLAGVPKADVLDSSVKLLSNGNRISLSGLSSKDDIETLKASQFIRIYLKGELKALYSYDDEKKDFKVFKML